MNCDGIYSLAGTMAVTVKCSVLEEDLEGVEFDSILDNNVPLYQAEFERNQDLLDSSPEFYQQVVDAVNSGNSIVLHRVYLGWNLISSPFEEFKPIDILDRKIIKPMFAWNSDMQMYDMLSNYQALTPGEGYWLHFNEDNFEDGKNFKDYAIVGDFSLLTYDNLNIGWNLVGALIEDLEWDSSTALYEWSNSTYHDVSGNVMDLGKGYWLFYNDVAPSVPND